MQFVPLISAVAWILVCLYLLYWMIEMWIEARKRKH